MDLEERRKQDKMDRDESKVKDAEKARERIAEREKLRQGQVDILNSMSLQDISVEVLDFTNKQLVRWKTHPFFKQFYEKAYDWALVLDRLSERNEMTENKPEPEVDPEAVPAE